ncbi:uncharacterized protein BX664DRAFT_331976 [Halteromyces radiatus]|uniref:uncharacterized protein n=1 Tax=Halteromyces radiatus TaxID=101107 RepID=UPI00221E4A0C|nr:uncharacterized protein BX664DRAFT_331976 [Halteromyces radiatus]KAI8089013.1 hypothetical protein BX664DRAFT_331976 [Halteromyces radiatus]
MTDLVYQNQQHISTTSFPDDAIKQTTTTTTTKPTDYANNNNNDTDAAVSQLLAKLDEGTQTIANLRSILTLKTAELNELMAQLEMTNQAITNVESTTGHIETMLKDLGLSNDGHSTRELLISAEASLDSAIKSAIHIYSAQDHNNNNNTQQVRRRPSSIGSGKSDPHHQYEKQQSSNARFVSRIRYKPDTKHILRQLSDRLRELELDAGKFFETIGTTNDVQALQKAYVDLDLAKTIALSAKSNLKRRKILLTSSRRPNVMDQVKLLGEKIREGVDMWKLYTRNAPMMVNGEDILVILGLQDDLLDNNHSNLSSRMSMDIKSRGNSPTNSSSSTTTSSIPNRSTWRQSTSSSSRPDSIPATTTGRNRSSSISSVSSIPVLATAVTNHHHHVPSSTMNTKRSMYRHSSAAVGTTSNANNSSNTPSTIRSPIKANIGVNRVRTSSLTNKNKASFTKTVSPNNMVSSSSLISSTSTAPMNDATISIAPMNNNSGTPKSMLKPPTERGPGSTLRIRSMLAKRNHQQPTTSKLYHDGD